MASSEDQMKMMMEDFNKLQTQLIDLRTENYELGNKLRKSETDNLSVQEKCTHQERELQKLNKLMKFPGFQAITKSKTKQDMVELIEENERLNQQMQRHEDDFKLQNQTLVEEVSRLSSENIALQNQISSMGSSSQNDEECQRLKAENAVLQSTVNNLKQRNSAAPSQHASSDQSDSSHQTMDELQDKLLADVLVILSKNGLSNEVCDGEQNIADNSSNTEECNDKESSVRKMLEQYFAEIKNFNSVRLSEKREDKESNLDIQTVTQEANMLRQQLNSVKDASKKEVQELRKIVGEWTDKAKKKQESFVKLQEEKEKMYEEYRKEVDKLKEDAQKNEQDQNHTKELTLQLNALRKENESLQEELGGWKQRQLVDNSGRVSELEEMVENLQSEKALFTNQLEEMSRINDGFQKRIQILTREVEDSRRDVEKHSELAERRKCLLDKNALERQQDIENHQAKIEEIKERHSDEMGKLVAQKSSEIEDLKSRIANQIEDLKNRIANHKKLKKELDEANTMNSELQEKITSLEKKSGWLERSLDAEQENCKAVKIDYEEQLNKSRESFSQEKDDLEKVHNVQLTDLNKSLKSVKESRQELEVVVEKLKQAAKDSEIEFRIGNKKNDQLIKDLKRQLSSERKRADQLSTKLQDFIQEVKVKQTYDEIFNPESLQMKMASSHKRQDSGSHISVVSSLNENDDSTRSIRTSSPANSTSNLVSMTSNMTGLSDETMDLISRYADLQQEKWMLEERVRHLEENGGVMADDLMQKSLIIQNYIMEKKCDSPTASRRHLSLKEKMMDKLKLGNSEELSREMNNKMQSMLEETLATNMQLQKDLDKVSAELERLKKATS